jgi:hypothetical protein
MNATQILSNEEGRKLLAGGKLITGEMLTSCRKGRHRESKLQQECVEWFRVKFPDKILFAIPNGGRRGLIEAKIMKGEGVLAGVPDLFLAQQKTFYVTGPCMESSGFETYHGLFIEMKTDKGKLSPAQKAMHARLRGAGYKVEIARCFDQFERIIRDYLT